MASLECLDCCVADVEGSVNWKLVLVIVSLLLNSGNFNVSVNCINVYTIACLLNSRACFVCARPNRSVSVQLKVWQLSYVCAAGSDL
jgi:hypothetical protein